MKVATVLRLSGDSRKCQVIKWVAKQVVVGATHYTYISGKLVWLCVGDSVEFMELNSTAASPAKC